jgi:hypothetical protein
MGEPHGIALDASENTVTVYSAEPSMSPRKCDGAGLKQSGLLQRFF